MKTLFALFTIFALGCCSIAAAAEPKVTKPNIIGILVDDMGFSDIGCYGSEIPTPNLDALAANGLKYTQFYNAWRCCPTRSARSASLPSKPPLPASGRNSKRRVMRE